MDIIEILREGDKQKETIQKSYRLLKENVEVLEKLSKISKLSQNQIVNSLLSNYRLEYDFIDRIKTLLKIVLEKDMKAVVHKRLEVNCPIMLFIILTIKKGEKDFTCEYDLYTSDDRFSNYLEEGNKIFSTQFHFKSYDDLISNTSINKEYSVNILELEDEFNSSFLEEK